MKSNEILLSVLTIVVLVCQRCWGICPNNWVEYNGVCYRLSQTAVDYEAAKQACAIDAYGRLAAIKTSQMAYDVTNALSLHGSVSVVWSRYVLERQGTDVVVVDNGIKVNDCTGCVNLLNETIADRSCIVIGEIFAESAKWTLADCNSTHSYICQIPIVSAPESGLKAKDYAAIGCGVFLAVSFVVVIVVDLIKNPTMVVPKDTQPLEP